MRDSEARPAGSVFFILLDDVGEELAGAVEIVAAAGAGHEGGEDGAGLEVLLGEGLIERTRGRCAGTIVFLRGEISEALEGAEDFVADFGLDGDEVEGRYVDGAARADALVGDVEKLPVEVEAFVGAEEVAGEDEVDEEFFADAERDELLGGGALGGVCWWAAV